MLIGKWPSRILKLGNVISLLYFTVAFALVICLSHTGFAAKAVLANYNALFAAAGFLLGVAVVCLLLQWCPSNSKLNFYGTVAALTLGLCAVQQWIIRQAWFITEWDPYNVVQEAFWPGWYIEYYSWYPNNLVITGIFRLIILFTGADTFEVAYFRIVCVGSILMCLSCMMVAYAAKAISGKTGIGYAVFILETLFILLSPQYLIPYTDVYGMVAPAILLFVYTSRLHKFPKAFLIAFVAIFGASIKPNTVIVLIAILIVELLKALQNIQQKSFPTRQYLLLVPAVLGVMLAIQCGNFIKAGMLHDGTIVNSELAMSPAHYLMMGWDEEGDGAYWQADVDFSTGISSYDDRVAANLATFRHSVGEMGPSGVLAMLVKKTLSNYSDGMGTWSIEGDYFHDVKGENIAVRALYGIGMDSPGVYAYIAQLLWMLILAGVVLQWFYKNVCSGNLVVTFTLMGQSIFLLLFECRARYFIQFWPYFVMASVTGWYALYKILTDRMNKTVLSPTVHRIEGHKHGL